MKLICGCLLALALLGYLADAQQGYGKTKDTKTNTQTQTQTQTQSSKKQQNQQTGQQAQDRTLQKNSKSNQNANVSPEFHTCDVAERSRIACGPPDISGLYCEEINCCFDGMRCYYGKAVTLQCTKDAQMIIVVAKDATLPNIDLDSISFLENDPNCLPAGTTAEFAIYTFPVTSCGTVVLDEPGYVVYENRMTSLYEVAVGDKGAITRDTSYDLLVQCRYAGTEVRAVVVEVDVVQAPLPPVGLGPLRVELLLANGFCVTKGCVEEDVVYNSFVQESDYPYIKVLRDPVYVQINLLERTDPNLVLTLGRCWATAGPIPYSLPQWDLLIDGCPNTNDHYRTALIPVQASSGVPIPSHVKRFVFYMLTFVTPDTSNNKGGQQMKDKGNKGGNTNDDAIYTPLNIPVHIHCNTAVCVPTLTDNCEPRCFRKRRSIGASSQGALRPESTVVSSKQIIFQDSTSE